MNNKTPRVSCRERCLPSCAVFFYDLGLNQKNQTVRADFCSGVDLLPDLLGLTLPRKRSEAVKLTDF